ncbi:hypothetical protein [Streptomyces sp. MMG1533]|uniref:hypothetical protein n=1 Tax=Streptomyces sp. MMG1533 TaxID=1415546 RepID=UPI0006B057C0|nr:hypothetical protein [Streptomyces sp. MMG1533]
MHKFKKAAAVAAMVGGLGLVGGGVASANGGHDYDDLSDVGGNVQAVDCDQEFDAGLAPVEVPTVTGDTNQTFGNFCTVVGSIG